MGQAPRERHDHVCHPSGNTAIASFAHPVGLNFRPSRLHGPSVAPGDGRAVDAQLVGQVRPDCEGGDEASPRAASLSG